jgi:hypothetical protein
MVSVVHNHACEVILCSVTKLPNQQLIRMGTESRPPVWDIRDQFGDTAMRGTNLHSTTMLSAHAWPRLRYHR